MKQDSEKTMPELLSEYKQGNDQYETRCNKCLSYFESDDELELFQEVEGDYETSLKGCPTCETDAFLMDLN